MNSNMVLPTDIYTLINEYAVNSRLYIIVSALSQHDCIFELFYSDMDANVTYRNVMDLTVYKINKPVLSFIRVSKLQSLSMCYCNIDTLLDNYDDYKRLEKLMISGNNVSVIPDFATLPLLKTFDISDNVLIEIPDFSNMPSLMFLHIDRNIIKSVPNFSNLSKLVELYMHYNAIYSMPVLSNLPLLEVMYCDQWLIEGQLKANKSGRLINFGYAYQR